MAQNIVKQPGELNLFARTGTVTGVSTWSETHVHASASGGGGNMHNVAPTRLSVSSNTVERNRFFLKESDGGEVEIDLHGVKFGVRDGHEVTAVYCGHVSTDTGWLVTLRNHHTGKEATIGSAFEKIRGKAHGAAIFFAFLVLAVVLGRWWESLIVFVLVMAGWGWFFYRRRQQFASIDREISQRAAALIVKAEDRRRSRAQPAPDTATA